MDIRETLTPESIEISAWLIGPRIPLDMEFTIYQTVRVATFADIALYLDGIIHIRIEEGGIEFFSSIPVHRTDLIHNE